MRSMAGLVAVVLALALAGCTAPVGDPTFRAEPADEAHLQIIEWDGHILHSSLDVLAHMRDPETALFPFQQAGFLVEIPTEPQAIEVMVSWQGDAGFHLHPHYKAEDDPALGGDTVYYGYLSEMFHHSPGCVRIPAADMAAGVWPMTIHPMEGTMDVDYTITVGILGTEGRVLDDMHGHRSDGDAPVIDHGIEECQMLVAA